MRLAKITNNVVETIIIGELVDFPTYTDVTNIQSGVGWTDNQDGTFTDNTTQVSIRVISVDDFIDRIPRPAFETITNHPSNEAKSFVSMLNARNTIPLDNNKTTYYVGKMLDANLITQAEHDAILG